MACLYRVEGSILKVDQVAGERKRKGEGKASKKMLGISVDWLVSLGVGCTCRHIAKL